MGDLNRAGTLGPLLGMFVPVAGSSDFKACTAVGTNKFDTVMTALETFVYTCDIDSYIAQAADPTAAAADGSMYVPAGMPVIIDGAQGARLALLRKGGADGVATFQKVKLLA